MTLSKESNTPSRSFTISYPAEKTWQVDLTQGKVTGALLKFAGPMILGNLLQQCYNIADTLIVGKYLGQNTVFLTIVRGR